MQLTSIRNDDKRCPLRSRPNALTAVRFVGSARLISRSCCVAIVGRSLDGRISCWPASLLHYLAPGGGEVQMQSTLRAR